MNVKALLRTLLIASLVKLVDGLAKHGHDSADDTAAR